jgi:hypothetical protein
MRKMLKIVKMKKVILVILTIGLVVNAQSERKEFVFNLIN